MAVVGVGAGSATRISILPLDSISRGFIIQGEIRIIFAGKELRDDVSVDTCDLGSQSILHAVRIVARSQPPPQVALKNKFL